jgi:hypothetical protein
VLHQAVFLLGRFLASARRRCDPQPVRAAVTLPISSFWDPLRFGSVELGVRSALGAGAWHGATSPTSACTGAGAEGHEGQRARNTRPDPRRSLQMALCAPPPIWRTGPDSGVTSLMSCFVVGGSSNVIPPSRSRAMQFLRRPD